MLSHCLLPWSNRYTWTQIHLSKYTTVLIYKIKASWEIRVTDDIVNVGSWIQMFIFSYGLAEQFCIVEVALHGNLNWWFYVQHNHLCILYLSGTHRPSVPWPYKLYHHLSHTTQETLKWNTSNSNLCINKSLVTLTHQPNTPSMIMWSDLESQNVGLILLCFLARLLEGFNFI